MYLMEGSRTPINAKDSPWDTDLTGSVASTVGTKIRKVVGFGCIILSPFYALFELQILIETESRNGSIF